MGCLWAAQGLFVGYPRAAHNHVPDSPWQPVDRLRPVRGQVIDCLWAPMGSMGCPWAGRLCLWAVCGLSALSMSCPWAVRGLPLTVCGLPMDFHVQPTNSAWTEPELCMGCPWSVRGLPSA